MNSYDNVILGDERDGIELALRSARHGRRVAIVGPNESRFQWELVREAADRITSELKHDMRAWRDETSRLVAEQEANDELDLMCWNVDRICGQVKFVAPGVLEIEGEVTKTVFADKFVLACGTRSYLPSFLKVDGRFVLGQESLLALPAIPKSVVIVGAGGTGLSTAVTLAKLGSEVTVVDNRLTVADLYGAFDPVLNEAQALNVAFRLDDEVIGTELRPNRQVAARTASGRVFLSDAIVVCIGREGCTEGLSLDAAGVGVDERGRVWCDEDGQTWNESIHAVGTVVGYPREARVASKSMFKNRVRSTRFTESVI